MTAQEMRKKRDEIARRLTKWFSRFDKESMPRVLSRQARKVFADLFALLGVTFRVEVAIDPNVKNGAFPFLIWAERERSQIGAFLELLWENRGDIRAVAEIIRPPLVPIFLGKGHELWERSLPELLIVRGHLADEAPLPLPDGSYLGAHGPRCRNRIVLRAHSAQSDVLKCDTCGFRVLIPIGLGTYGDLRAHFAPDPAPPRRRR